MSSDYCEITLSDYSPIDAIIFSTGESLLDILNQESSRIPNEEEEDDDDSSSIIFIEEKKSQDKQIDITESIESDKLSTLFNPTGRERNSTGPLKQWLYAHQDYPYPKESDRQELMKQTNMSSAQITIWFTNARVKMRKEKKLVSKTKKKRQEDDLNHLAEIISITNEIFLSKRFVLAYSSLNRQEIIDLYQFASFFPNQISISDCVDDNTTHLIIGKEEKSLLCPLTKKLFESIARHLYIITYRWIKDCLKQNEILNEENYEVRGDIPFDEYHDGMKKSRLLKDKKLFENCQFFILCDDCQDYMSKNELASLIELCHGHVLNTYPLTTSMDKSILTIVLCNDLLPFDCSNRQQLFELSRSNGVYFINPEWILESIVQFSLQPFDAYEELF